MSSFNLSLISRSPSILRALASRDFSEIIDAAEPKAHEVVIKQRAIHVIGCIMYSSIKYFKFKSRIATKCDRQEIPFNSPKNI